MRSITLEPGQSIYRQGDASDHVYFIEEGLVEVRRASGEDEVGLATLGKGEILGEMGVLRGEARSTSLVAATHVRLSQLDGEAFLKVFGGPDGVGLKLLRMICDRLTDANAAAAAATHGDGKALRRDIGEIRLLGASPETRRLLGPAGVVIDHLPFEVGLTEATTVELERGRLSIPLPAQGAQLSRRHFCIQLAADGGLEARDLESQLGCIVNGRRISGFERIEEEPVAHLRPGDNEIVAGGQYSPVRFTLRLRPASAAAA